MGPLVRFLAPPADQAGERMTRANARIGRWFVAGAASSSGPEHRFALLAKERDLQRGPVRRTCWRPALCGPPSIMMANEIGAPGDSHFAASNSFYPSQRDWSVWQIRLTPRLLSARVEYRAG